MSQEFRREIKSIDGRPYLVHIKMYHNSDGEVKAEYCVTRNTTSYKGNEKKSVYIQDGDNEKFAIISVSRLKKYWNIVATASDKEIASLKPPIVCQYKTGEQFQGDHKYSVVLTNHRAIVELPAFLEFKNFVDNQVGTCVVSGDSGIESE